MLNPGTRLGPYEIVGSAGAGGMGEVYRARDTRLDRTVAIKVLPGHLSSSPDQKQRFAREARAISSLNHPRICTLHDVGHQDGTDFLVMEYLEGESLADSLQRGPLPLKDVLKIAIEICEALEAAHRSNVIHRDLKPGNIMLTKSGAKLMDFGLAKAAATGVAVAASAPLLSAARTMAETNPASPLTSAGAVVGTVQYMSPEQIEGKEADARSDLFALGAILYEMTTGKRAFEGKSQISVASAILEKDPEPMRTHSSTLPTEFEHVVSTCLAKNPDERLQCAHDFKLELKWIAEDVAELGARSTIPERTFTSRVLPWSITAAVVLVAVAALLFRRGEPVPAYTTVSFREGILLGARFSHDGQTIVYSGEWEGEPAQLSVARAGSPESRPLGIASAEIASMSASDQLAIFLGCDQVCFLNCGGTLATVSLAGGAPRTLTEHVAQADWHPDGKRLVLSFVSAEGARLEFPAGHVLFHEKSGWFGHPRFSPDGSMIAFENHPILGSDQGNIELVDLKGNHTVIARGKFSLEGLAWNPNGKEVWFAGSNKSGWADTIYAVTPGGSQRIVLTLPSVRLHDVSKDGRVLLSRENWRFQLKGLFPGDKSERGYSWLDDTGVTALSLDGRLISIYEGGEIYGFEGNSVAYYRSTDGSPAARLGVGAAAISPDGKWILLGSNDSASKLPLQLQPIGPGETKNLPTPGLIAFDHQAWSDNGRQIVYEAQTEQNEWNVYTQAVAGGNPVLLKRGGRKSYPVLSPSGETVALHEPNGGISLYRINEANAIPLKGSSDFDYPVRFVKGGRSLLVATSSRDLVLTIVDLVSGRREPWKRIPDDINWRSTRLFVATPDLKYYAYPYPRLSSVLYVVDNLH